MNLEVKVTFPHGFDGIGGEIDIVSHTLHALTLFAGRNAFLHQSRQTLSRMLLYTVEEAKVMKLINDY